MRDEVRDRKIWSDGECLYLEGLSIFFFEQKTAYEMRIGDWSSGVCSSDLIRVHTAGRMDSYVGLLMQHGGGFISLAKGKDRKRVVLGTSVSVRVDLGGRLIIQKKKTLTLRNAALPTCTTS